MDYKVTPPAWDSNGLPCWNVWIEDTGMPETFHTYGEAVEFATNATDQGYYVFTDFN